MQVPSVDTNSCASFTVFPIRFTFQAEDPVCFPHAEETNVFRGTLGAALRRISPRDYSRLFEPRWPEGPSGYRNAPRPFVLRWPERASTYPRGAFFSLDVFLFHGDAPPLAALYDAFEAAAAQGIGIDRGRAALKTATPPLQHAAPLRLQLESPPSDGHMRLYFVTPTELKSGGEICTEPAFELVFRRLAERIWSLGRLYQGWQDWDYSALLEIAAHVRMTAWTWRREEASRHSSRTQQTHSLGGFVGCAEYAGPVGAFLNLLEIGRWTGIGRQTVWGKGEICVERR